MPNSDTWPRTVAMEPLSNMDSAGSCDSVISMNSGFSEDSMEHLSAEERACLMYLEETIESLEVQDDSGLSNDEPDPAIWRLKHGPSGLLPNSGLSSDIHSVPVDGGGPAGTAEVSHDVNAERKTKHPTLEPQLLSTSANGNDTEILFNVLTEPKPPGTKSATGSVIPVPASHNLSTEGDPQSVLPGAKLSSKASSEMDVALIPPPSDFRDEPVPSPPQLDNKKPPALSIPFKKPSIDLELLRQKAYAKREPGSAPVSPAYQDTPPTELCASLTSSASNHQTGPQPVAAEPKSPPAVAPKPKKLPSNIILKSQKSVGSCESSMGHPAPSTADRLLLDPQRVRMEALRKLGLLKSEEVDSGPALSPKRSTKNRMSWAAPPSPLSSPPPQATLPSTPSASSVNSMPPAHTPVSSSTDAAVHPSIRTTPSTLAVHSEVLPDILPVPAAFSDTVKPSLEDAFDTELTVSEKGRGTLFNPPAMAEQLAPLKRGGVKSATLERSGLGLGSYIESIEDNKSPSQLRNSRPRPASLGSGKDFSSAHGGLANSKKSLLIHSTSHPVDHVDRSQKLPRSQGISVLISPHAQNQESRREALKKLGLLRD